MLKVVTYGLGNLMKKKTKKSIQVLFIVLELAQKQSLYDYILDQSSLPEPVAAHLFMQFLKGLMAIHVRGICHRDIKAENLLLADDFTLKIADFGYAAPIEGKILKNGKLFTICGTKGQIAPEIEETALKIMYTQSG